MITIMIIVMIDHALQRHADYPRLLLSSLRLRLHRLILVLLHQLLPELTCRVQKEPSVVVQQLCACLYTTYLTRPPRNNNETNVT